jgi:hypothetical protein
MLGLERHDRVGEDDIDLEVDLVGPQGNVGGHRPVRLVAAQADVRHVGGGGVGVAAHVEPPTEEGQIGLYATKILVTYATKLLVTYATKFLVTYV